MKDYIWGAVKTDADAPNNNLVPQKTDSNHVYFYSEVDHHPCLELNRALQEKADELLNISLRNDFGKPKIYLHINSYGGSVFAGISSMDTILRLRQKVDIITIVEGGVASAGTFLSIVGTKRWMTRNSFMLIHQLSSLSWGKYRELKDDMENCDRLMEMIKRVYNDYASVPQKEIDQILDHDLWWDSSKCLEMKLIDKII